MSSVSFCYNDEEKDTQESDSWKIYHWHIKEQKFKCSSSYYKTGVFSSWVVVQGEGQHLSKPYWHRVDTISMRHMLTNISSKEIYQCLL